MDKRGSILLLVICSIIVATTTYFVGMDIAKKEKPIALINQSDSEKTINSLDFYSYDLPLDFRKSVIQWVEDAYALSGKHYTIAVQKGSFAKDDSDGDFNEVSFIITISGDYNTVTKVTGVSFSEDGPIESLQAQCTNQVVKQPCIPTGDGLI